MSVNISNVRSSRRQQIQYRTTITVSKPLYRSSITVSVNHSTVRTSITLWVNSMNFLHSVSEPCHASLWECVTYIKFAAINSLGTGDANVGPGLSQRNDCCIFDATPLFKPVMTYCQVPEETNFSGILSKHKHNHWKIHLEYVCKISTILCREQIIVWHD